MEESVVTLFEHSLAAMHEFEVLSSDDRLVVAMKRHDDVPFFKLDKSSGKIYFKPELMTVSQLVFGQFLISLGSLYLTQVEATDFLMSPIVFQDKTSAKS